MIKDKRIRIITGNYGSGKTEFAVNYTMAVKQQLPDSKVAIADLDIVNVYFRSRERKEELEAMGITVISSSLDARGLDVPAVSAAMVMPAKKTEYQYIVDLGGNDVGTHVLGRLTPLLKEGEYDFFMVVNVFRPDTSSVEKILIQKENLEEASGLSVTGFINNSNLVRDTSLATLLEGDKILKEVEQRTGIHVRYISYIQELVEEEIPGSVSGKPFPMKFHMRKEWM
ncbi:MAG: ATP-binding protein [Bacillota bacterium]